MTEKNDSAETEEPAKLGEVFGAAVRKSPAGKMSADKRPTGRALLGAIGGVRGLVESALPTLVFLVVYLITHDLVVSVVAPIGLALIFIVARAGARAPITAAVAGAIGIAFTALLTVITGRAENNFLPGIWINSIFLVVLIVSLIVRRPLLAFIVGFIVGDSAEWFADKAKRRAMTIATWGWIALFAARLAIEVPLYLAADISAQGVARLITGVPLYATMLWITWLLVRTVYSGKDRDDFDTESTDKVS
jgi:Protein of unknown function (DUF3159)